MSEEDFSREEWRSIGQSIARLRASVMAVTFAVLGAAGLFTATAWLIVQGSLRGVEDVGPTLGLLGNYFPGYSVTWGGAALGVVYGALTGAATGYVLATVYNAVARLGTSGERRLRQ